MTRRWPPLARLDALLLRQRRRRLKSRMHSTAAIATSSAAPIACMLKGLSTPAAWHATHINFNNDL